MKNFTDALLEAYYDLDTDFEKEAKQKLDALEAEYAQNDAKLKEIESTLKSLPSAEARLEAEHPELVDQFKAFTNQRRELRDTLFRAKTALDKLNDYSADEWDPQGTAGGARYRSELTATYQDRIKQAENALAEFEKTNTEMLALLDEYANKYKSDKKNKEDERNPLYTKSLALRREKKKAKQAVIKNRIDSMAATNKKVESMADLNTFLKDWASILDGDKFFNVDAYDLNTADKYYKSSEAAKYLEYAFKHAKFYLSTEYLDQLSDLYYEADTEDDDTPKNESSTDNLIEIHFEDKDETDYLYLEAIYDGALSIDAATLTLGSSTYKDVINFLKKIKNIMGDYFYAMADDDSDSDFDF